MKSPTVWAEGCMFLLTCGPHNSPISYWLFLFNKWRDKHECKWRHRNSEGYIWDPKVGFRILNPMFFSISQEWWPWKGARSHLLLWKHNWLMVTMTASNLPLCSYPGHSSPGLLQAVIWLSRVLMHPANCWDAELLLMASLAGGLHSGEIEVFLELSLADPPSFPFPFIGVSPVLCFKDCLTTTGSLLFFPHRHLAQ